MFKSTYLDHTGVTTVDARRYAPAAFEHIFDTLDGQQPTPVFPPYRPAAYYPLPAAVVATGVTTGTSPEEVAAVKTAQLVAQRLADEAQDAMAFLGEEFAPRTYACHAGQVVAQSMVECLLPLGRRLRAEVVARAVDPTDGGQYLDLVLDTVGRMLAVYCDHLPGAGWVPMTVLPRTTSDVRVVGWRGPDGQVVLDLLGTFGPDGPAPVDLDLACTPVDGDLDADDVSSYSQDVEEVLALGRALFGSAFLAVRYLPTFEMRHARIIRTSGPEEPYVAAPMPARLSVAVLQRAA